MGRARRDKFEIFVERLGVRVAELRDERGITQEQLAGAAEIGASYLAKIEIGIRKPSLAVLHQLAMALGVEPKVLLDFDDRGDWQGAEAEREWSKFRDELAGAPAEDVRLLRNIARKIWHR